MVLIVPLAGPSAFEVVFVLFAYSFARLSYYCKFTPRWSIRFRDRFRMAFLWFCNAFVWFLNRPPRWPIGFRGRFRMYFQWFCNVFVSF